MSLPEWSQSGSNHYDYALNGVPFLSAATSQIAYARETATIRKEQIDTSLEPGEQSLQNWWYRSQSSFDLGAGAKYFDVVKDEFLSRRYFDSHGVDTLSTPGEVSLLRKMNVKQTNSNDNQKCIGFSTSTSNGVLYSYGTTLSRETTTGSTNINWGGSSAIYDIDSNGSSYFVMAGQGLFGGALPDNNGNQLYRGTTTDGLVKYAKERLIAAFDNSVYVLPVAEQQAVATSNVSGDGTYITYTFTDAYNFTVGQVITVTGSNISGYNVNLAEIVEVSDSGLEVKVESSATGTNTQTITMTVMPEPLVKQETTGWKWSAIADAPNGIYLAGYVGDRSYIYRSTIDDDGISLTVPSIVAELPYGEVAYSMVVYLGTYIIIGTNIGVRVGVMAADGTIVIGPLTIETENNVKAIYVRSNYAWVGGANSDGKVAIYRINLSKQVDQRQLLFAYEKNLYSPENFAISDEVLSIAPIGVTGRIGFTISTEGLYFEDESELVEEGWLETGKIRFDTAEDKIFQYLKVSNLTSDGTITTYWRDENNTLSDAIYSWDTSTTRVVNMDAAEGDPHPWASYKFVLERSNTDDTQGPVLVSYQLKASPAYVKQRIIQVPMLAMQYEKGTNGMTIERDVWTRLQSLENIEEKGSVVIFQDLNTGERRLVLIEEIQFISRHIPSTPQQKENKGGILLLRLRTVDNIILDEES